MTTKPTNTSGVITKISTQVGKKKDKTIKDYIKIYENEIAKALPNVLTPERFTRMAMTAITQTPKLGECTPQSFIGAMLNAAQLGLEPNTPLGQAYLIPYGKSCQSQIGYKGLVDLAYRGGQIKKIEARCVYENDKFEFEYGIDEKLRHIPAMTNRGDVIALVLVYKCGQKKLNNLYYQVKDQRRCSTWRKTKNLTLRNSSSRSWICIMPEEPRIHNWKVNMA